MTYGELGADQPLDLRRSLQIVRRHLAVVVIAAGLGLLAGAAYAELNPPIHQSTALVVLPSSTNNTPTLVAVGSSNPVLDGALPKIRPAMSLRTLRGRIQVASLTTDVVSITAEGRTDDDAEDTANAVANSYVAYLGSAQSSVGQIPAKVLVPAVLSSATPLLVLMLATGLLGFVLGTAIGVVLALAIGRNDRRLRRRDDIADSIGVPVLASIAVAKPTGAAGWIRLLADYEPSAADEWRLRSVLTDLKLDDLVAGDRRTSSAITVLSLSNDQRALAFGPQLAAFAASVGVPTVLVIGTHQYTKAAAALAAAASPSAPAIRSGRLRLAVDDDYLNSDTQQDGALTIVVAVADVNSPQVPFLRMGVTVLGVSAGEVTSVQLARVAASVTAEGSWITGILVGDPDPADATTGRLPQLARPNHSTMPARLTVQVR
jgi:capsular polysaccharide biosynthesis protein